MYKRTRPDHNKSAGLNVKCIASTTTQRRGAICIIVDNPDEDNHNSIANDFTSNSDTEHCDMGIDNDDDDDDDDEYENDDGNESAYEAGVDVIDNDDKYTTDSANDNNNIRSSEKVLRTPNAKTKKKMRKKCKRARISTANNQTANSSVADAQVHPKKYNFWHNLLVTQKNGKSTKFIDYFRNSSRDIQRKTGEG